MRTQVTLFSAVRRAVSAGALVLALVGSANAVSLDFSKFLSGGGGGTNPEKQRIAQGMGAHICVDIAEARLAAGGGAIFHLWSAIPQPNSRITTIALDTGRHGDLFRDVSVLVQPRGARAQVLPGQAHAFLRSLTPDYTVAISRLEKPAPGQLAAGLAPGNSITLAATLGPGKTFANVISALKEGLDPATAGSGLRVGVIVLNLLGGPPRGVATINDDGGFVTHSASSRCRRS